MSRELKARIFSAVILMPFVLGLIIIGGIWFKLLLLIMLCLMLVEWTVISHNRLLMLLPGLIYITVPMIFWLWFPNQTLMLYTLLLVWLADIGAYFGGKIIGGIKLAPKISPNKTWSGAIVGFSLSLFGSIAFKKELCYAVGISTTRFFTITVLLIIISILGDLLESKIKRMLSVKDSGNLIPGHGGILDRLDSFLAVSWGLLFISILIF